MKRYVAVVALMACSAAAPAFAEGTKPYLELQGGWSSYAMGDFNERIRSVNAAIAPLRLRELNNGLQWGAALGLDLPGRFCVGVAYDRLLGSDVTGYPPTEFRYDVAANALRAIVQYDWKQMEQDRAHVGVGVGVVSEAGSIAASPPGSGSPGGDLTGTGPLFEFFWGTDFVAGPRAQVSLEFSLRYAAATGISLNGEPLLDAGGDESSIDYSGAMIRLRLRFTPTK